MRKETAENEKKITAPFILLILSHDETEFNLFYLFVYIIVLSEIHISISKNNQIHLI